MPTNRTKNYHFKEYNGMNQSENINKKIYHCPRKKKHNSRTFLWMLSLPLSVTWKQESMIALLLSGSWNCECEYEPIYYLSIPIYSFIKLYAEYRHKAKSELQQQVTEAFNPLIVGNFCKEAKQLSTKAKRCLITLYNYA